MKKKGLDPEIPLEKQERDTTTHSATAGCAPSAMMARAQACLGTWEGSRGAGI